MRIATTLSAPAGRLLRGICLAVCVLSAAAAVLAIVNLGSMDLDNVVEETSVLEAPQVWVWVCVSLVAGLASLRPARRRELWLAIWIGLAGCLAALRELDLHVVLNPENIGVLGLAPEQAVRYRLDWWMDPDVSPPLKLAWGSVLLVVGAALVLPLVLARVRWLVLLIGRDRFAWSLAAGAGLLALGFVADDALRATAIGGTSGLQTVEEGFELAGCIVVLAATVLMVQRGHHAREAAIREGGRGFRWRRRKRGDQS